jgi:hypothetical protein
VCLVVFELRGVNRLKEWTHDFRSVARVSLVSGKGDDAGHHQGEKHDLFDPGVPLDPSPADEPERYRDDRYHRHAEKDVGCWLRSKAVDVDDMSRTSPGPIGEEEDNRQNDQKEEIHFHASLEITVLRFSGRSNSHAAWTLRA